MIEIAGLGARTGAFALRDVSFTVPQGGYGVVIGPAGSGKTTLLESIAGVRPVDRGAVALLGRDVTRLPPESRQVGIVYQHGLLFPHLSVAANVAYGAADAETTREAARRMGADALYDRPLRSLSGGERQVVALARALARRPRVLLLDEPFSALDPRRRTLLRREVRAIHREWGLTVLQVTHDFTEAGLLGDVAILLDAGRVLQHGPPDQVFRRPASPYIAEFLGAENVLAGEARLAGETALAAEETSATSARAFEFRSGPLLLHAVSDAAGPAGVAEGRGHAVIRAEEILVSLEAPSTSARNVFRGVVEEVTRLGALTRVTVDVDGVPLVAALTTRSARELELAEGRVVWASFKAMAVHLC